MRLIKPNPIGTPTLDELFVEKYEWLMRWAMYFAQGELATAEDLVQDTFVRFAVSSPDLDHHDNAEALLYTYLRHVHLAHLRRIQRYPLQNLTIGEFDSLSVGLRQNPSVSAVDVQNNLRRILVYLCWRKESTKAASILILRFFYGFFPEEIMQIGILSRPVVDNGLRAARGDLKRHLVESASGRVQMFGDKVPPAFIPTSKASQTDDFIAELRAVLLNSRQGICLPVEELAAQYEAESPKPIECELLAHIVSCRRCLDAVIHSRKLPPLDERSFEDALVERHDSKLMAGKGDSPKGERDKSLLRSLKIVHDRIEETLEHEPRTLSLVVNGHLVATQEINSSVSRQELEINIGAPIELIEIISEQGICLLSLPVEVQPPAAPPEIYRIVRHRGGRTLEAWLRFTSMGPRAETLYRDPAFVVTPVGDLLDEKASDSSEADIAAVEPRAEDWNLLGQAGLSISTTISGQTAAVTPFAATILFAGNAEAVSRRDARMPFASRLRSLLLSLTRPSMNPLLTTACVLAVASVVFFTLWWRQPLNISANTLLVRAEAWDAGGQKVAKFGVIRQQVSVKAPGYSATRAIYRDAQGLRRPKQHQLSWADEALKTRLAASGVDWDAPLSATTYQDWHDHQRVRADAISRDGSQLVKLTTTIPSGQVRRETLTVRVSDFHPIERTVEFDDNETVEIAELDYSVLPWSPATEGWFEPVNSPSLVIPHTVPQNDMFPRLPHLPSDSELDEAELEARLALHQLDADSTNERVEIERTIKGIQVKGIVATAERKREIEARLHPIPYLFASIFTFDELTSRQAPETQVTSIKSESLSQSPSPLEQYLSGHGASRADISELGDELSDASVSISQESKAIAELVKEFGPNRNLSPLAEAALEKLLADHKVKIVTALDSEEKVLAKIEPSGHTAEISSRVAPPSDISALLTALDSHRALAMELISGGKEKSRSAAEIALDLDHSLRRLRAVVEGLSDPRPVSAAIQATPSAGSARDNLGRPGPLSHPGHSDDDSGQMQPRPPALPNTHPNKN